MDEHELYGIALDWFITERTAWAKALRAEGRREEAAAAAALRKPSVAAWAVNQLIREQPDACAELFDAGDGLRAAQDRMLSGKGTAEALREAADRERAAVDALLAAAERRGMSAAVSDRVAGTLHAAALDEDARAQVRDGRLVQELAHVGFGGAPAVGGSAPRRAPAGRTRRGPAARASAKEQAEQRRRDEERKLAERDARRRVQAAERARADAESRHAAARSAAESAEAELADAGAALEAASAELDEATRALEALTES